MVLLTDLWVRMPSSTRRGRRPRHFAHTIVRRTHATLGCLPPTPPPHQRGVPNAHSVARLAYPWSPWTPDRPWSSRVRLAEPRPSRSQRRYSTPSEREHRGSTRTPHLDKNTAARQPPAPDPTVKVGQLSSQLREGRPTDADPGHSTRVTPGDCHRLPAGMKIVLGLPRVVTSAQLGALVCPYMSLTRGRVGIPHCCL